MIKGKGKSQIAREMEGLRSLDWIRKISVELIYKGPSLVSEPRNERLSIARPWPRGKVLIANIHSVASARHREGI